MTNDLAEKVNDLEDQKGTGIYFKVPFSNKQIYVVSSPDVFNWIVARWTGDLANATDDQLFSSRTIKGASRYLLGYFRDLEQAVIALNEHNIRSKKLIKTLDEYIQVEKESQKEIADALDLKLADI